MQLCNAIDNPGDENVMQAQESWRGEQGDFCAAACTKPF